ncbi:Inorganic diphosphatase [Bertholletia excelsa]
MAGIVVVFDFDKTIIDLDSDNWVVDELGATDLFNQLLPTVPWNALMDRMMKKLHSQGKSIEDVAEVLKRAPIHPRVVPAIKAATLWGTSLAPCLCDLRIVSDANRFFIETIVEHIGIKDCFSEINTNPTRVDEEGRLRIFPYIDFHSSPHGCDLCPPNMCKGLILERIQASVSAEGKKKFIYLGDGSGDFCPSLKLGEGDYVMPRKNYPLWDLICKNRDHVKAEIHEWCDGEELERVLLRVISMASMEESSSELFSVDCKFETVNGCP